MGLSQYDEQIPVLAACELDSGDGTTPKQIYAADYYDVRLDTILITTNSLVDIGVCVFMNINSNGYSIFGMTIPAGSGFGGVPAVDVIGEMVTHNVGGLLLPKNQDINIYVTEALAAGKVLDVVAMGGSI